MAQIDIEKIAERCASLVRGRWLLLAGLAVLGLGHQARTWMRAKAVEAELRTARLAPVVEEAREALAIHTALRDERESDLGVFKRQLEGITTSRRALYEGGLALQNEKRMLEKQLEIVSTYVLVEEESMKAHLMRGDQALESWVIGSTPTYYGGESRVLPQVTAINSKERYAHPERPKAEQGPDGQLIWEPPQVGESARANALGEYVMFMRGPLILHGPPKKLEEHALFPHACLSLSLPVARKLYAASYIGTKVMYKPIPKTAKK